MSREECSRILNLDVPCVDENTALAAMELSELTCREDSQDACALRSAAWEHNGLSPVPYSAAEWISAI